ncbi:MAG: nucleotidyltransferase domain-containing protein [Chitinophagaceae bacterium]
MDIQYLRDNNCIVFECISGSRSYGLDIATSDTDIKGVFILPKYDFYGLKNVEQLSNETNDIVFYELGRFFELLLRNNPNIVELLGTPPECIIYKHPLWDQLNTNDFLSKLCRDSFANYAWSQVKKAKGLNKKIHKPVEEERKTILHFCNVVVDNGSKPLLDWLAANKLDQPKCGLAALSHMRDMYVLYYDETGRLNYKGIMQKESSNEVALSSIPKDEQPVAYLNFNKDAYSIYCKEYNEYWSWVDKRNEARYENTLQHGKNYDAKNMMHVFRLLDMAEEIAKGQGVITKRPNREYLLSIRSGSFYYEELVKLAEDRIEHINLLYERSDLPDTPDEKLINDLLVQMREDFYK